MKKVYKAETVTTDSGRNSVRLFWRYTWWPLWIVVKETKTQFGQVEICVKEFASIEAVISHIKQTKMKDDGFIKVLEQTFLDDNGNVM